MRSRKRLRKVEKPTGPTEQVVYLGRSPATGNRRYAVQTIPRSPR